MARTLFFALFAGPVFGLAGVPISGNSSTAARKDGSPCQLTDRTVFVAGGLTDEQLIALSANIAASGRPGILLLDSHKSDAQAKLFLEAYRPGRVVPVGSFPNGIVDLERRLGIEADPVVSWTRSLPVRLWRVLFPCAERVVVCPVKPRGQLLQAACLAGVLHAPLCVTRGTAGDFAELVPWLSRWQTQQIFAAGAACKWCRALSGVYVVRLQDEKAVASCYWRYLRHNGTIRALVVTNPADDAKGYSDLSSLAPWIALHHRAALLLTNPQGTNVTALVREAVKNSALQRADALLLLADLKAIPMEQRPNPIPSGKDPYIEMEPLTPTGAAPFSFATGRLFDGTPAMVSLVLARQQLLCQAPSPRKALVISNAGGGLPLLEAISRNTAKELRNSGYETTALFGKEADKDEVRRLLPDHDIILWEGHYNTLVNEYGLPDWTEPLAPALVFLQSCLALNEDKALPLLQRGGIGVVGSSTRIYSGSGGAFTLAFFDALLYDHQSVGSALRQAKNFLLAYSLLKQKRLGDRAKLSAANLRTAWAFSLWGDPTLQLPVPPKPANALAPVKRSVHGNTIILRLPPTAHDKAVTAKYNAQMLPNGRLAGLLSKMTDEEGQRILPFLFAEVYLPQAPPGHAPQLHSRLPASRWVFCWDKRRRAGYLLVIPRPKDQGKIRFHINWVSQETVCSH